MSTTSHDMGRKRCLRETPCKPTAEQRRNRSSVKNIGPTSHILRQTHIWTSVSVGDRNLAINNFSPTMKSIEILYHAAASSTLPMFSQCIFNEQINSTHFIWTSLTLQSSVKFEGVHSSELGTTTPKPEPIHINSRSHGQKHAKHIQKSSTTW